MVLLILHTRGQHCVNAGSTSIAIPTSLSHLTVIEHRAMVQEFSLEDVADVTFFTASLQ